MPKIQRTTQQIFAANAGSQQITAFGTAKDQTPVYTQSVAQIQNTNYGYGWSSALLPDKAPWQEDMNALFYAITTQLAYLFQEGVPEYDPGTSYSAGALVKSSNTQGQLTIYKSLVDDNLGNPLTSENYWAIFQSESALGVAAYEIGLPQPTFSNTLLPNEIWLEGQAVSRTTYSKLFAIYGTTYGSGNGSTTFNLPDFRERVLWGSADGTFGYIEAALPPIPDHQHGPIYLHGSNADLGDPGSRAMTNNGQDNGQREFFDSRTGNISFRSDDPIFGKGKTVVPPGLKCRVKTRFI